MGALELPADLQQRILANRAIVFREMGNQDEVNLIVSKLKSLEHDWKIDIAISTLDKDYATLRRQLISAKSRYNIQQIASWPLFSPVGNKAWFQMVFKKKSQSQLPKQYKKHKK
jgi:hypothetical protein